VGGTEAYPEFMRAVTIVENQLVWAEHPDPVPAAGELLVAVAAAGLNAADLLQRKGFYPAPPGVPADIPGMEFAGEVVAVGEGVTRYTVGDRVMALVGGGAQAELVTVAEAVARPVPAGLAWPAAGGFPEVFSTAHDALVTQGRLGAGDRVLISGAAGGVGSAAVQLAHAAGAQVVASVRNPDLRQRVSDLGADRVIEPGQEGDHGPYDVSLELVGGPGVVDALGALATGGRIVVIGVGAGAKVELNLLALMGKRATIGGSTLRARSLPEKTAVARKVEAEVLPGLADGSLVVPVADTFPLADADAAYQRFAAGAKFGKIVLVNG